MYQVSDSSIPPIFHVKCRTYNYLRMFQKYYVFSNLLQKLTCKKDYLMTQICYNTLIMYHSELHDKIVTKTIFAILFADMKLKKCLFWFGSQDISKLLSDCMAVVISVIVVWILLTAYQKMVMVIILQMIGYGQTQLEILAYFLKNF